MFTGVRVTGLQAWAMSTMTAVACMVCAISLRSQLLEPRNLQRWPWQFAGWYQKFSFRTARVYNKGRVSNTNIPPYCVMSVFKVTWLPVAMYLCVLEVAAEVEVSTRKTKGKSSSRPKTNTLSPAKHCKKYIARQNHCHMQLKMIEADRLTSRLQDTPLVKQYRNHIQDLAYEHKFVSWTYHDALSVNLVVPIMK